MCLIVFAWNVHPKYKLVLAANRDEFYQRPTAAAHFWEDHPQILGGRDLQAQGTWMAMHQNGRFAALTNYRDIKNIKPDAKSRGEITTDFLLSDSSPEKFLQNLNHHAVEYNGFNALVSDENDFYHYSNYERKLNKINPGIYGLSNALLDTPWPKVTLAKNKLQNSLNQSFGPTDLIELMNDTSFAEDLQLPDTGVGYEREKQLSAMCIRMENYGTHSTTAILIDRDNQVTFAEKIFPVGERKAQELSYSFKIQ